MCLVSCRKEVNVWRVCLFILWDIIIVIVHKHNCHHYGYSHNLIAICGVWCFLSLVDWHFVVCLPVWCVVVRVPVQYFVVCLIATRDNHNHCAFFIKFRSDPLPAYFKECVWSMDILFASHFVLIFFVITCSILDNDLIKQWVWYLYGFYSSTIQIQIMIYQYTTHHSL